MRTDKASAERLGIAVAAFAVGSLFLISSAAGFTSFNSTWIIATACLLVLSFVLIALPERGPILILIFAIVAAACQTSFAGFWLPASGHPGPSGAALILIELKTGILLCGSIVGVLHITKRRGLTNLHSLALPWALLAVLALIMLVMGGGLSTAGAAYLRNFATPAMVLILCFAALHRRRDQFVLDGALLCLGIVLTIASVAQYWLGGDVWDRHVIHLEALQQIKGPMSTITDFFGHTLPRLRSLPGEPIGASYTFAALACWAIMRRRPILACLFLTQNILTFAKGGMLVTVFALLWAMGTARLARKHPRITASIMLIGMIPTLLAYAVLSGVASPQQILTNPASFATGSNSAMTHASGFIQGIGSALTNPIGAGTGSGGNFGNIFSTLNTQTWIATGGESAIGVLAFQLGLGGLVLFAVGAGKILTALNRVRPSLESSVASGAFVGWLAASMFQENSFGPQAALPVLSIIVLGVFIGRQEDEPEDADAASEQFRWPLGPAIDNREVLIRR